jgi:hypothetical protein
MRSAYVALALRVSVQVCFLVIIIVLLIGAYICLLQCDMVVI